jgi:hypothetical protein
VSAIDEIRGMFGSLDKNIEALPQRFQEQANIAEFTKARGEKYIRIPLLNGQAVSGALVMGGDGSTSSSTSTNQEPGPGPEQGWSWSLTELNIEGLTTSDAVGIYRSSSNQGHLIWVLTGNQPCQTWGRGQKLLRNGDRLLVVNIGTFTSTAPITLSGVAREVPAEKEFRL